MRRPSLALCCVFPLVAAGTALADPPARGGTGFTTGQTPRYTTGEAPRYTTGQAPRSTTGPIAPTTAPPPACGQDAPCALYFTPYPPGDDEGGVAGRGTDDRLGSLPTDE